MTDCAMWLNGRNVGARWDGTIQSGQPTFGSGSCVGFSGNMSTFSDSYKTFLRQCVRLFSPSRVSHERDSGRAHPQILRGAGRRRREHPGLGVLVVEGVYPAFTSYRRTRDRQLTPRASGIQVENADDWSYQRGLEGGWIPQDPADRMYPNICSGS